MATATTTALEVVDPIQGELLDLTAAQPERLAQLMDDIATRRDELADVEQLVSDELVRRLDRAACWTLRVGDPRERQFEIKASSPDAGTEAYDALLLEAELRKLIERGTIDESAAAGALERSLSIKVRVPFDADLDDLVGKLSGALGVEISGVLVDVDSVGSNRSPKLGAIGKLRKVDGTGAALDRAQLRVSAPARKAKVKLVQKER